MVDHLECRKLILGLHRWRKKVFNLLPFTLENVDSWQHIGTYRLRVTYKANSKWFCPFCIHWIRIIIILGRVTLVWILQTYSDTNHIIYFLHSTKQCPPTWLW